MKTFPNRDQAKQRYERAKPYVTAGLRAIVDIFLEAIVYILDALKTLVLRARQEPFIFLAAVATVIYAVFAYGQWQVMSGQLEAMRTDQRPWIPVEPRVGSDLSWDSARDARITIDFEVENTGKSPAVNVEVLAEFTLLRSADPRPDQKRICDPQRNRFQTPGNLGEWLMHERPADPDLVYKTRT